MAKRSAAAQATHDVKKQALEADLAKYRAIIRDLRTSSESALAKTHKQREYHRKITEIESELASHGH